MLWIWWPGYVVPACMVLGGLAWKLIHRLPYKRREELTEEQLCLARSTFCLTLWQLGAALAALTVMVMRTVRLLDTLPQEILLATVIVAQLLSTKLVDPAVKRALRENNGDCSPSGKEDNQ